MTDFSGSALSVFDQYLKDRGVLDKAGPILAENDIDQLETLQSLGKQDLLDIGLKLGTVAKLLGTCCHWGGAVAHMWY